jgi:hypothetical protein
MGRVPVSSVQSFTHSIDDCKRKAFENADVMVKAYCHEEAKGIAYFSDLFDEHSYDHCVLGHVNGLLQFFDKHLQMSSEIQTKKYKLLIAQYLFESVENRFIDDYEKRVKGNDVMQTNFPKSAEQLIKFEEVMRVKKGSKFKEVFGDALVRNETVEDLIAGHVSHLYAIIRKDSESVGTLKYRVWHSGDNHVEVKLDSLCDIVARIPGKVCNPSVTLHVAPDVTETLKGTTLVYEKALTFVLFD